MAWQIAKNVRFYDKAKAEGLGPSALTFTSSCVSSHETLRALILILWVPNRTILTSIGTDNQR